MPLVERLRLTIAATMLVDDWDHAGNRQPKAKPDSGRSGFQPDMSDWKSDLRCSRTRALLHSALNTGGTPVLL